MTAPVQGPRPPRLFAATVVVPLVFGVVAQVLSFAARHWAPLRQFLPADWLTPTWSTLLWMPARVACAGAIVLAIDALAVGWPQSAARRLFVTPTASTRTDLFYFAMRASGGIDLLALVASLGTCFWLATFLRQATGLALLASLPFAVQFVVVYLVHSFVFYWAHRLMHTRWLWELHKVHHAAESLNGINAVRNHPVDRALMVVLHAVPALVLGASPVVVTLHAGVDALYQLVVHTEIRVRGRFWDRIWITPAAHRVHHATDSAFFNRNFGILTVWDRLFGTYHEPVTAPLTYGVDGGTTFNDSRPVREIVANLRRWGRGLRSTVDGGR